MSKKDYQAIARALHETKPDPQSRADYDVWEGCVAALADALAADNPAYRARFVEACETGACKGMRKRPAWDRNGCREVVCTCHDDTAKPYACSRCGCRPQGEV